MTVLKSALSRTDDIWVQNTKAMQALVADLRERLATVAGGGGEVSRKRHTSRGKMLARERVDLLLDPCTALLELSPLAV